MRAVLLQQSDRERVLVRLSPDPETREQVAKIGGNALLITGRILTSQNPRADQDRNFDSTDGSAYACPVDVLASIR